MAQQLGMMRVRGKVGNVVGFSNSASNKTNNNFYRERATTISNPKTYRQAAQRAKVKPAQAFYSAFESILNHAFLPNDRASKNRNKFMAGALAAGIPDVPKDANYLPVMDYQVSRGSLGLDELTMLRFSDLSLSVAIADTRECSFTANESIADVSSKILASNIGLVEGEELTFLFIIAPNNDKLQRESLSISFVLDLNNTVTTMGNIIPSRLIPIVAGDGNWGRFGFQTADYSSASGHVILAAALIISSKNSSSWRYTNSYMCISPNAGLTDITEEVILSYMDSATLQTSNQVLQQANNVAQNGIQPVSTTGIAVQNRTGYSGTFNLQEACLAVMSDGSRRVIVDNDGQLYGGSTSGDGSFVGITRTVSGNTTKCTIDTTKLTGNPTININAVLAAGLTAPVGDEPTVNP